MLRLTHRVIELMRAPARHAVSLSPGLVDAALSAIAGFAASLYAVRNLEGADLGAYSLYLSAAVVGGLFAQQLVYLPGQIASLDAERGARPRLLRHLLAGGAAVSLLVAPPVALSGVIVGDAVSTATLVALGSGAAAAALFTPMQDHVRSALYLADLPRRAAAVSAAQVAITLVALLVLAVSGLPDAWVPLWAVATGSAGALLAALVLSPGSPATEARLPSFTRLARRGAHLLPAALIQEATIFIANTAVALLASPAALGRAEAARLVARPVQTMSLGVSRVLAPRLMEAGNARDVQSARSAAGLYLAAIGIGGLLYFAVAGWSYPASPFVAIVPAAYVSEGLVALFLVATALGTMAQVPRGVLLGAGLTRDLLWIGLVAAGVRIAAVLLLAAAIGAYALPVAHLISLLPAGGLGLRAAVGVLRRPDARLR